MTIDRNNLSRNTAFAVRMFYADSCAVLNNDGSHTYREDPVNSDAGAILMIVRTRTASRGTTSPTRAMGCSWGSTGTTSTPNNNLFIGNDCSVLAAQRIRSDVRVGERLPEEQSELQRVRILAGLLLQYRRRQQRDRRQPRAAQRGDGRRSRSTAGYNNSIRAQPHRRECGRGSLWKGDPIPGYESQPSERYTITDNTFADNVRAVDVSGTDELDIRRERVSAELRSDRARWRQRSVTIDRERFRVDCDGVDCQYRTSNIEATHNIFPVADTALIRAKIYDADDDPQVGPGRLYPV